MRYLVKICERQLALTQHQLEILMTAVHDAEQISEKHVGTGKGSQGYQKAYIPSIEVKQPHEWLQATVMADDYVDAIKLTMRLDEDGS